MKYKITYDLLTNELLFVEPVTTGIVEVEDDPIAEKWLSEGCRAHLIDGVLVENTEPICIERNICPDKDIAEIVNIPSNVGMKEAEYEHVLNDAFNILMSE
jgi:hypothetical protein